MVQHSDEVVVNSGGGVCQTKSALRIYDCFATERSLVPSAAATQIGAFGYKPLSHPGSSVKRAARKSSMLRNVAGMCLREAYTA